MDTLRYVVLHHTQIARPHFDLMVERISNAPMLQTWQLDQWPIHHLGTARVLADHRRDYLTYEGPVSGDRGRVKRIAAGTCCIEGGEENRSFRIVFDIGNVLLFRSNPHDGVWSVSRLME